MALDVGDLIPSASGSASLGAEQLGQDSFTGDIRPFAHVHMNSGVIHGPYGSSGVVRYENNDITLSVNGGITYEKLDLQRAYVRGNEIKPTLTNGQLDGVVLKNTLPVRGIVSPKLVVGHDFDYLLAASGFSLNPDDQSQAHLLRLGANGILMRGSGLDSLEVFPAELFMGYIPLGSNPDAQPIIFASGSAGLSQLIYGGYNLNVVTGASVFNFDGGGLSIGMAGQFNMSNPGFEMDISAGTHIHIDTDTGDVASRPNQNILIEPFNGSGKLTYRFGPHEAFAWKPSYTNVGGVLNDGFFPIPHSGQIVAMIAGSAGFNATLQTVYDNGNAASILAPQRNHVGLLVREKVGGFAQSATLPTLGTEVLNFGIAVSGFSPNSSNPNSWAFAKLNANSLLIRSSGIPSTPASTIFLGFDPGTPSIARMSTSGILAIQAISTGSAIGVMDFSSATSFSLSAGTVIAISTSDGSIALTAGAGGDGLGGQIELNAFGSSGELEYRFGPFEAWHCSPSHTASFFPIPHSGQVIQMMLERVGLQQAYNAGPSVVLATTDMIVTANTAKPKFSTFGTHAEIFMSGIPASFPSTSMERGDMNMMAHGLVDRDPQGQTTLAGVQARSLGLGTLGINTGSGIANIMMGSGIQRFLDNGGGGSVSTFPTFSNVPISSQRFERDQYYAYDSSVTGVRIFVPGCYMVFGKMTAGNTNTTSMFTRLAHNGSAVAGFGCAGPVLAGSIVGLNVNGLINLNAGDTLALQGSTAAGTATYVANESALQLVYLGPARGAAS